MPEKEPPVRMLGISKNFDGVKALQEVDFTLNYSEIVGLVGDNGAGKSTLIKILSGVYPPDKGEIFIEGKKVDIKSPSMAKSLGIETVYQDLALVDVISVAKNIFLGKEPTKPGLRQWLRILDKKRMEKESLRTLHEIGIRADVDFIRGDVEGLSGGERQAVAVGKTLVSTPRILILDEPTAAISVKERTKVLGLVVQLKKIGIPMIFISHNMEEVFSAVDRVVVLSRGRVVGDKKTKDTSIQEVVEFMVT